MYSIHPTAAFVRESKGEIDMILRSDRMAEVHSDIRGELFHRSMRMQKEGINVLKLNTGNPATFGFTMADSIRKALEGNEHKAVGYCDFQGMPAARQAICDYHTGKGIQGITPDDVFVGNGVSEVVNFALMPLLNPGDEVLVPTPVYTLWSNTILLASAKPVYYRCDEAADWNPDINDIKAKITSKTKAIVIINPNNPTGALYSTEVLNQILDVAREHDLIVFSDEIYDRMLLDDRTHVSTASLAPDLVVITMNGLSKSHVLCGFRVGWMVISGPREKTEDYRKGIVQLTSLRLCSNALAQLVIPAALEDNETPFSMCRPGGRVYEQRKATCDVLDQIDGISYVKNKAAFYLFPKLDVKKFNITSDKQFASDLLDECKILIVPGSGFDWPEHDHFRIVMLPKPEDLTEAMTRMGKFLDGYKQK